MGLTCRQYLEIKTGMDLNNREDINFIQFLVQKYFNKIVTKKEILEDEMFLEYIRNLPEEANKELTEYKLYRAKKKIKFLEDVIKNDDVIKEALVKEIVKLGGREPYSFTFEGGKLHINYKEEK